MPLKVPDGFRTHMKNHVKLYMSYDEGANLSSEEESDSALERYDVFLSTNFVAH